MAQRAAEAGPWVYGTASELAWGLVLVATLVRAGFCPDRHVRSAAEISPAFRGRGEPKGGVKAMMLAVGGR